jgi:hypothetical protein
MGDNNAIVVAQPAETRMMKVDEVISQMGCVHDLMKRAMNNGAKDGDDFGTIPGCGDKPALKKPGAEKLNLLFRLAPTYKTETLPMEGAHREYRVTCTLTHIPTGLVYGQGEGSCSTMETKYRWRNGERKCPACGGAAIIKGKEEYGGGWLCFAKKGGCGAKFANNDQTITGQTVGRVENTDIADVFNTVLKMACKRALVAATLNATGASALFTQDLDELQPDSGGAETGPASPPPPPAVYRKTMTDPLTPNNGSAPTAPPQKPATPPPTNDNGSKQNILRDRVVAITPKTYAKKGAGGNGTYWIIDTGNGTTMATFSETLMKDAEFAMAQECFVDLEWEDKGRGKNLKAIWEVVNTVVEPEVCN